MGIFINSDAWNFWFTTADKMSVEGIKEDVDFYAVPGVEAVFYNMNFQRCFFPTKIGTPIWKDCELDANGELLLRGKKTDQSYKDLVINAKLMWERLPDFMKIRYDYCHEKGIEMWHSMRMNDVHWTPLGLEHRPQHSDLWQQRKDLIRAWYRHVERGDWHDNAFDFGKQEVYEHHLGIFREYMLDYESDGIELDWMRSVPIFQPGYDELNKGIFTQFMRDARKICDEAEKKWGHKIRVAVRVPCMVQEAMGCGFDIPTWAKEKLIDVLIPSENNTSTEMYQQIELWRILAPKPVILAPCVNCNIQANHESAFSTIESDAGFTSAYYQMGADTIYTYNHFPNQKNIYPDMQAFFTAAADPKKISALTRRQCATRHDPVGEGYYFQQIFSPIIWPGCSNGSLKINAGLNTVGRSAKVIIGATVPLNVRVLVNTVRCDLLPADTPLPNRIPKKDKVQYIQAQIPDGVLHDGWNVVELYNYASENILADQMEWTEIMIEEAK